MKSCPYCAKEIQDAAIKCKHCGEWLNTEEEKINFKSTNNNHSTENITEIKRQIFTVISFGERPDKDGEMKNDIVLPYADMADWVYTTERLIFAKAEWRYSLTGNNFALPPLLLPFGLIAEGIEKFQSWKKDHKINFETIDTLCKSGVAACIKISDTNCCVCDVKKSFSESLKMSGHVKVSFHGIFHTQSKTVEGDVSSIFMGSKEKVAASLKKRIFNNKGTVTVKDEIVPRDWVGCALL